MKLITPLLKGLGKWPSNMPSISSMPQDEREVLYYNLRASLIEHPTPNFSATQDIGKTFSLPVLLINWRASRKSMLSNTHACSGRTVKRS